MADLLTHVLVAYTLGIVLSWKYRWIKSHHVTMMMVGAAIPDLVRIRLLIPSHAIEDLLGIPFSWDPIHTLGGSILIVLILTMLFKEDANSEGSKRLFLVLFAGMVSHLFLDALLITASGHTYAIFWPLTDYRPVISGVYLSTDVLPAVISFIAAASVRLIDR